MPELPEVETIRRDLEDTIIGKKIAQVEILKPKLVKTDHEEFITHVVGQSFETVERIGKLLMLRIAGKYLLIHLKMTGQLIYVKNKEFFFGGHPYPELTEDTLFTKWTGVVLTFKDKSQLLFNDQRLFGYFKLVSIEEKNQIVEKYGIEPLTDNFTWDLFYPLFKKRQTALKALLLNQEVISGLGNIYVDESCFRAGIRPQRRVPTLTKKELEKLYVAIDAVITQAVALRGTTFKDYRDTEGNTGNFMDELKVYGRGGEPCVICCAPLQKIKVAGRGTVYCDTCQK